MRRVCVAHVNPARPVACAFFLGQTTTQSNGSKTSACHPSPTPSPRHAPCVCRRNCTSITKRSRCLVTGHKKLIFLDSGHMSLSGVCVCALPHLAQIVYMVMAQCRINGQFCSVHDGAIKGRIQLLRVPPIGPCAPHFKSFA